MFVTRFIISAVAVLSVLGCAPKSDTDERRALMEASRRELATAVEERDELLSLVKDITRGMSEIKRLEHIMAVSASDPREDAGQRNRIMADIATIRRVLAERRQQLADLEERLSESSLYNVEVGATIGALREELDAQSAEIDMLHRSLRDANEHIASLSNAIDSLSTTVTEVTVERDSAQTASHLFETELNTCYYIVATRQELKEHSVIESSFLRKTRLLAGDFDKDFFTAGDKRHLCAIPLHARKAKVLTRHPSKSFEIVSDSDGVKILHITDTEAFWSLSNYLVVQI